MNCTLTTLTDADRVILDWLVHYQAVDALTTDLSRLLQRRLVTTSAGGRAVYITGAGQAYYYAR